MSRTDTAVAPAILRTANGREAARWVAAHCREVPWLSTATVLTTVAGAALQVLPVLLLGRVVDAVVEGESQSVLVTIGALMVAAALLGA
ncbi:ABC transporter ATP-binding protein, partial [Streptomyces sp. NPDC058830]